MPDRYDLTSAHARSFIVIATGASLAAWNLGFDLGAFDNVDHRKIWAVLVLSIVALTASFLLPNEDFSLGWPTRLALLVPGAWLVSFFFTDGGDAVVGFLSVLAVLTLPVSVYVLVRLFAPDFFGLTVRLRLAALLLALGVFGLALVVGWDHQRFLTCDDFARAGEFVPEDCTVSFDAE